MVSFPGSGRIAACGVRGGADANGHSHPNYRPYPISYAYCHAHTYFYACSYLDT